MSKKNKVPAIYKYGIELTKPFSKEMYNHNDKVVTIMKGIILSAWSKLMEEFANFDMDTEWEIISDDSDIVKLQKEICYSTIFCYAVYSCKVDQPKIYAIP